MKKSLIALALGLGSCVSSPLVEKCNQIPVTVYEPLIQQDQVSSQRKYIGQTESLLSSLCAQIILFQQMQKREQEEQLQAYRLHMKQTTWSHAWNYIIQE